MFSRIVRFFFEDRYIWGFPCHFDGLVVDMLVNARPNFFFILLFIPLNDSSTKWEVGSPINHLICLIKMNQSTNRPFIVYRDKSSSNLVKPCIHIFFFWRVIHKTNWWSCGPFLNWSHKFLTSEQNVIETTTVCEVFEHKIRWLCCVLMIKILLKRIFSSV